MRRMVTVVAVCAALVGCGIGSSETVEEIEPDELAALDQTTTTTSTTIPETVPPVDTTQGSVEGTTTTVEPPTSTVPTVNVTLYFISGSQIVPVETPVPADTKERGILTALAAGPPAEEFEAGVRTAVPADLVRRTRPVGHRITIDFNGEAFRTIESDDQRLMVAQIVLTLTRLPGIDEVLFTTDGEPLLVYQRDGELTDPGEPVTRDDYEELLAEGQSTGTP